MSREQIVTFSFFFSFGIIFSLSHHSGSPAPSLPSAPLSPARPKIDGTQIASYNYSRRSSCYRAFRRVTEARVEFIRHGLQMVIHNGGFGPPLTQFLLIIDRYGLSGLKFSSRGALSGILSRVFFIFSFATLSNVNIP